MSPQATGQPCLSQLCPGPPHMAQVPALHRQQQRAQSILIPGAHTHPSLQQHGDHLGVASPGSRVQRGLTVKVLLAQVTALGEARARHPLRERWAGAGRGREGRGAPREWGLARPPARPVAAVRSHQLAAQRGRAGPQGKAALRPPGPGVVGLVPEAVGGLTSSTSACSTSRSPAWAAAQARPGVRASRTASASWVEDSGTLGPRLSLERKALLHTWAELLQAACPQHRECCGASRGSPGCQRAGKPSRDPAGSLTPSPAPSAGPDHRATVSLELLSPTQPPW